MKKIDKIFRKLGVMFLIAASLTGISSCNYLASEEYLHEVDELNDIWYSRKNIRQTWATCFGQLPNFFYMHSDWPFAGAGDEGYAGVDSYTCLFLAQGKVNPDNVSGNTWYWYTRYTAIRRCNQFLENSHLANDRLLVEGEVESYNNDVRFLRAFNYSLLLELYGPFTIIDHTIDYSDVNMPTRRNTIAECVDYLVTELDDLIEKLPRQADIIQTDLGRPSKGAAMAMKARVLLWAASPLVNGNKEYATFVDPDNVPYIDQNYDENKWRLAAQAYKEIVDLPDYHLFTLPADANTVPLGDFPGNNIAWPNGPAGIDPYKSYKALFAGGLNYWNSETIFQVNSPSRDSQNELQSQYLTWLGWPRGHRGTNNTGYTGGWISATQKIVDAYFMNNGKSIEEEENALYKDLGTATTGDGYYIQGLQTAAESPVKTNWLASATAPIPPARVLNREARFYASIGFQGRGQKQDDITNPYYFVNYFANGVDGWSGAQNVCVRTGYPIVKWLNDGDLLQLGNFKKQIPVFRLAEVYLGYAEALNEYDPTNNDIVKYLNLVRFRAGLPGYELANQAVNRERIKHERFVELAFENGKRYFDMRRWKDAEKVQKDHWGNSLGEGGLIYGCNYKVSGIEFYDRTVLENYSFKQRDYFLPLQYAEVANHWGETTQNPGW
jgi:hypothetical protein